MTDTAAPSQGPGDANQHSPASHRPVPGPQPMYGFSLRRINIVVCLCLAIFIYLYFVDVFLIIVPWLSYSVPGVTNLGLLTFCTCMGIYNYLFCVLIDAGRVPQDWQPDQEGAMTIEVKRKDGAPRYCQKCLQYKPPRTHHCRVCNRCVLRMDHHCPWTNNCIGHANYRAFMLCLIYVSAALVHTVGLITAHVLHALQTSSERRVIRTGPTNDPVVLEAGGWSKRVFGYVIMQTIAFFGALPLCVGILMLLAWHIHLITVNKTTIEYQEGVRSSIQSVPGVLSPYEHPYDLGPCANLMSTLGDNPLEWCTPPCEGAKGGTVFPTIWEERALGLGSSSRV